MYYRWTEQETNILINKINQLGYSAGIKETARVLNIDLTRVRTKAKDLGMRAGRRKYTESDKAYLQTLIQENPGNLCAAFRSFADKMGVKFSTITALYYSKKSTLSRDKMAPVFIVSSKKKINVNKKNFNTPHKPKKGFFKALWALIKEYL